MNFINIFVKFLKLHLFLLKHSNYVQFNFRSFKNKKYIYTYNIVEHKKYECFKFYGTLYFYRLEID